MNKYARLRRDNVEPTIQARIAIITAAVCAGLLIYLFTRVFERLAATGPEEQLMFIELLAWPSTTSI